MGVRFINLPVVNMKRVLCSHPTCMSRNDRPQWFWVVETDDGPYYCSKECKEIKELGPVVGTADTTDSNPVASNGVEVQILSGPPITNHEEAKGP